MKYIFRTILALAFFTHNAAFAQTTPIQNNVDSVQVDYISDSLLIAMDNRDYEKAYIFVNELKNRDTLSSVVLFNCADCMIYMEQYDECIDFCNKWESRFPQNGYSTLFLPLRGECYYYLSDYENAEMYLSDYKELLSKDDEAMSTYYSGIYATVLHNLYKYDEANVVYESYFHDLLDREGLQLSTAYLSEQKDMIGRKLYDYAYNNFFLGNEEKGMLLLSISSQCGNEWAQTDYTHLSNCETIMMDLNLKNKILNEYAGYLEQYDFKYVRDSLSGNSVAEDFWNKMFMSNTSVTELQKELQKPKIKKMLQKAINELSNEYSGMMSYLTDYCAPYSPGELEHDLVSNLTGNDTMVANDFRIYPASEKNAFATPYGQIYLTSGLVLNYHFKEHLLLGVCAHEMTHSRCFHSLVGLWKQYEKERKNEIAAGIVAGLYAVASAGAAMYAASNGVSFDQSYYDDIAVTTTNLYTAIDGESFYYQFKYSRWQEIEADLMAYRFCEAIGLGGYSYIMALQLLNETDLYMKADRTDDHPTMAYRIAFLKWIYANEHNI